MKKLLLTAVLGLTVLGLNAQIWAQNTKVLNQTSRIRKNPVIYSSTNAYSDGRGVWLEWKTESETKNLGFFVYRIVGGEKNLVSPTLIAGAYLQAAGERVAAGSYSFFDRFGDVNSIYVIESYNVSGQKHYSNSIQTQLVDDLTTISGISSEMLENQARNANPVTLHNDSILPKELIDEVSQSASQPDPAKQLWVAAQPGVKIGVKNEGFYRVSRASLEANGFNVSAPSQFWQLYVNGIEQAINVGGNGDYIEFYGKGIDTLDSDTQSYFLVVGTQNGKRIVSTTRRRIGGSVLSANYSQSFSKRERFVYFSDLLNGETENLFGTVINNAGGTVSFNLSGVDFTSASIPVEIKIQGLTLLPHQTKITLNGVDLGTINGNDRDLSTQVFNVPVSGLREGANSLVMTSLSGASDISLFSSIKIDFARRYQADQNQISFYVPNYKENYVTGFSSPNIRVFDTTNPDAPLLISGLTVESNGGNNRVYLPSNRGRVMFAVEDSGILQPASIIQNTPSTLSTSAHQANLIIISYKGWLTDAENWAAYRRQQGFKVEVVNVDDIFDEFSYGVMKADSIRSFLQYAKNNWQTPPSYILLIGDASYDPKGYSNAANISFVPTRIVDTTYMETGSDDTLADFNDDGLAEIAIGRIPARTSADITLALSKVMNFEQTASQSLTRGAIFASDLPNGYDFEGVSDRLCSQLGNSSQCVKINRGQPDAHNVLVNELNNGRFLVNYSGHGTTGIWATTDFFSITHASQLTNTNKLSVFTLLTCLNGYFLNPGDSLSESLLKNPNGGAAASWASSGLTTPDVQEIMATRFYSQIAAGNLTRMGDLVNDAKTTINFGRDVRLSWVLLGDPMMKLK